jgi:nucleoside-diphosphate-sugar epimerase
MLLSTKAMAIAIALPAAVRSLSTSVRPLKVTVFGGTGYVGSAVCERLVKRGHKVTAVSRRGVNPKPESKELSEVRILGGGHATDALAA